MSFILLTKNLSLSTNNDKIKVFKVFKPYKNEAFCTTFSEKSRKILVALMIAVQSS